MKFFLIISFFAVSSISGAQQVVTGRITDITNGEPVTGAIIYVANTTVSANSNESGNYKITVPGEGSYEIVVSLMGYRSIFHKINEPKSFHEINFALEIEVNELQEVVITAARSKHKQKDIDLFWYTLLGVKPSKKGLEVLNPEKVYFFLNNDNVLHVSCKEPIEIVNHEAGYLIRYVLQNFQYNYPTTEYHVRGSPFFEELIPQNNSQKRNWEKKRQNMYAVSLTRFIRSLYRDQIHEAGFLLSEIDTKKIIIPYDILQVNQDQVQMNIESPLFLACLSKPITDKIIENINNTVFGYGIQIPIIKLFSQQITIYPDGTFSGTLHIHAVKNDITKLSAMLPVEYGYDDRTN